MQEGSYRYVLWLWPIASLVTLSAMRQGNEKAGEVNGNRFYNLDANLVRLVTL